MSEITSKSGSFQLMVRVGSQWVPAHNGGITRSSARLLKRMYAEDRPHNPTKVVTVK